MESKVLARIGAIVFIAFAITATIVQYAREDSPAPAVTAPSLQPPSDPLRERQRRCQQMGEAAANDAECLAVWAETRDRFLGRTPNPAPSQAE